jgi:hypothetical protein
MIGKGIYSATLGADSGTVVAPQNASRTALYIKNLTGGDLYARSSTGNTDVPDGDSSITGQMIIVLGDNESIYLTNADIFDCRNYISFYSLAGGEIVVLADEMSA